MTSLRAIRTAAAVRKQHKSPLVCKPTSAKKADHVLKHDAAAKKAKTGHAVARVAAATKSKRTTTKKATPGSKRTAARPKTHDKTKGC